MNSKKIQQNPPFTLPTQNDSAWTLLHTQIHQTLRQRKFLSVNDRILIAVSGGQDSLCLAKLLLDLRRKWHWKLAIAHCDHRWRSDSGANAEYVAQLAKHWDLPFYLAEADDNLDINSEAGARQWRYKALEAIANEQNYSTIVLGHTQSDRAETLLFNLMRGTGADGLQALTWQRPLTEKIQLVRPMLEVTRSQTGDFCRAAGIFIWQDATNQDVKYARNRIRQQLLPYLAATFNPQVEQHMAQTAELLSAEVEYLEAIASDLLQSCLSPNIEQVNPPGEKNRVNRRILQKAPLAIQRRAIRQWLQKILPVDPNFEQIDKLIQSIAAPNRSQTDPFPGGAIALVEGDWIVMRPHPPHPPHPPKTRKTPKTPKTPKTDKN